MAKEARKTLPKFTSPRVVFVYPKLTEPDYGNEKFPKPDGEYSVKGKLSSDEAEAFAARKIGKLDGKLVSLNDLYEQAKRDAEAAYAELDVKTRKANEKKGITGPIMNPMFEVLYDKDTEEETGEVAFKATKKASGEVKKGPRAGQKWSSKPDLYDASGKPLKGKLPNIWGGSEGKLSFSVSSYFIPGTAAAGLKFMLDGAQVIDLVSNGSRSAESHGFGAEDGGYEYDPSEFQDETDGSDEGSSEIDAGTTAGEDDF